MDCTIPGDQGRKSNEDNVKLGRKLSGWTHIDVTRDGDGNSIFYIDGEKVLEFSDDLTIKPQLFYFNTPLVGPLLDNLVVRDQVIEIKP